LTETQKRLADLRHGLQQLKTREANAAIRAEIAAMANALQAGPFGPESELEHVMQNIERRVSAKERRAEARLSPATESGVYIDWRAEVMTEDASAEIERLLEGDSSVNLPPDGSPAAAGSPACGSATPDDTLVVR
jgi:hypothetical protein